MDELWRMPLEAWVSVLALLGIAVITVAGVFSPVYRDNLMQRVGMAATSLASLALVDQMLVHKNCEVSGSALPILYSGVLLWGLGTAQKVWAHRPHRRRKAHP